MKELRKIVAASDVVLQVLDARDPEGFRSKELERLVMSDPNKKLVLVLTKIGMLSFRSANSETSFQRP